MNALRRAIAISLGRAPEHRPPSGKPYTIEAAGHTWYFNQRAYGPGCWHRDDEGGRCLSLQGVLDEHAAWAGARARELVAEEIGDLDRDGFGSEYDRGLNVAESTARGEP